MHEIKNKTKNTHNNVIKGEMEAHNKTEQQRDKQIEIEREREKQANGMD